MDDVPPEVVEELASSPDILHVQELIKAINNGTATPEQKKEYARDWAWLDEEVTEI